MSLRRGPQAGMTLVIALILLALMTVMAIASFNTGKIGMQIVGNMQQRNEVVGAANAVLEEVLSTTRMFQTPGSVFLTPCAGANTRCFDMNGDGTNDITVALTPQPTCVQSQTIMNAALNLALPDDQGCATGAPQLFGVAGVQTGSSICANSLWEVNAVATDSVTNATATVTEGAAVRVSTDDIGSTCP